MSKPLIIRRDQVLVEFESEHHPDEPRQIIVTHDAKGGIDLAIRTKSGRQFAQSWFLSKNAALAVALAIKEYYGE